MAKYRKKPVVITAVQLRWDTWDEMCAHADVGRLEDGKPQGTHKDLEGNPLPDDGPGLLIPTIVLEIDPSQKRRLYAILDHKGITLREWFLCRVREYLQQEEMQLPLFSVPPSTTDEE